jgi:endonuclease YncB( thermonuclease family)
MAAKRARRRKSPAGRSKSGGMGLLPWLAVATVALVVGYDHWADIKPKATTAVQMAGAALGMPSTTATTRVAVAPPSPPKATPSKQAGSLPVPPAPIPVSATALAATRLASPPLPSAPPVPAAAPEPTAVSESFGLCGEGTHFNCVVDGNTFWVRGLKVRLADIDTPDLSPPRCLEEERRGQAAKVRLLSLLNAGPFTLEAASRREENSEKLRTVLRGGRSIGDAMVAEGLARRPVVGHASWCA